MPENKTDLVVQARAKGFQELQQQAAKLVEAASKATQTQAQGFSKIEKGGKAYRKEIQGLDKDLKSLTKTQIQVTKAILGMDKGTALFKQLKENLKNVNTEIGRITSVKDKLRDLFGPKDSRSGKPLTDQDMARGGFTQGLVQGSTGINLQRGPGMYRQAAGMALGGMARGFAGAPFGGVQGMQQGLAGIPIAGGFLAGQFGTAMGFGEGALDVQRTRMGAMPMFGGDRQHKRIASARQRATAESAKGAAGRVEEARLDAMTQDLPSGATDDVLERYKKQETDERFAGDIERGYWRNAKGEVEIPDLARRAAGDMAIGAAGGIEQATVGAETIARQEQGDVAKRKAEAAEPGRAKAAGARAARRTAQQPFQSVKKLGLNLGGMSEAEAIQAMTPMLERAGGGIEEAQKQKMVETAFAAKTAYGVDTGTAGAFLGAGRRGGMVGGLGKGGEMMASTIGDALKLSLEGSELTDYMQQMANGFESWKTTGMPINPKSIGNMATTFASTMGGVRGAEMGRGMAQAGQRLAQTGPQDSIDLMMLQTMGGYKGGGIEAYMDALEKLESTQFGDADEIMSMVKELASKGTGALTVKDVFNRKGIQMGTKEARLLTKKAQGGKLSDEEQAAVNRYQQELTEGGKEAPTTVKGLTGKAEDVMDDYGGAIKRAAALQNKQNKIGEALLPSLQDLQSSSANIASAFQTLADGPLKTLTGMTEKMTKFVEKMAISLDEGGSLRKALSDAAGGTF